MSTIASLEAERAVVGCCLISGDALADVIGMLKPDDFADTNCRLTFDTIAQMYTKGIPVDDVTIVQELAAKNLLNRLGGYTFLNSVIADVTTSANVKYYAEIVRDRAIRRKVVNAGKMISNMADNLNIATPEIFEESERLLYDAGQNKDASEFLHVKELLPSAINALEMANNNKGPILNGSYSTGLIDLDALTGGLQPGSLNIIAARPSMGKTALALNIAQFGGHDNSPVLIFSLEMPAEQLLHRMISAQSGVNLSAIMRGTFTTTDFQAIKQACDILAKRELYINDATQLSAMEFRARCRRFKMRHPDLALIVIDYLQLMTSGDDRSNWSRQQEVSDISRMLKAVAREINCPIIALSQLSRAAEQRTDKKPQLADLRDSGAIEQDADAVMLLFRQDYYGDNEHNDLADSEAELRLAKNRNGATGIVKLTFRREITRFFNHGNA